MALYPDYFFDLSNYAHASLFQSNEYVWTALNRLKEYLKTLPLGKIEAEIPAGVFLIDPHLISIEKGVIVEPGSYIKGPCHIGKNSTVRHGAYIRGFFISGDRCVIGHDTEVKNTIFLDDVHAAHFAYLGDSILGNDVNLGAGTKCANLKLDEEEIFIQHEEKRIGTHLRKLGAIIGDKTKVGCNAVTNPGTLMGKDVLCYPCLNVKGFIESSSIVKGNTTLSIKKRIKNEY